MVGRAGQILRCAALPRLDHGPAALAFGAPSRPTNGVAANAGPGSAQHLWAYGGYGRLPREWRADDLRVLESEGIAGRQAQESAAGARRRAFDRTSVSWVVRWAAARVPASYP